MILIGDSGSTKTDWCIAAEGKDLGRFQTSGINPFQQDRNKIDTALRSEVLPAIGQKASSIRAVYFYGAGCTPAKAPMLYEALDSMLPHCDRIEVAGDMLGAARALCGDSEGIACILGTGSNSCLFDGREIKANVSPLGYILGDEGSGAVLGRLFIGSLLKGQMPEGLCEAFLQEYGLTSADIVESVYRKPFPNRFLAGFSPFIAQHLDIPAVYSLVQNSFDDFLVRNVLRYNRPDLPLHFIGSVAFHYREVLSSIIKKRGLTLGSVLQSPMEGLIQYHHNNHV
ncbi:BadF/BadG/BcrA/BcrD ATPase family protein [Porphyromonas gingivalis W4087]|uniref:BadF/BadG/BcrA/BcrD ATPase family protein n=1 Tax=Porphyromonas gingivalis F0570 TaxID=1227271 RepID=A0A0E2M7J3_PORGN|nr:BadF/BadG/BcrA/BcrD ATPase family protein [Porphyromonas gingivalis]ERJ68455.1 BadF/BadG/BcrA/BcrD ATPase family protein [Porphyromonas gingivalis F0570]ERJ85614.1 BadF/BadG/BcrA/BcrD ATPase family protein [Porphyromonas gingivalis W4087]MDP0531373.1 ATPase [Porphyromonas gingivalis]MDP0624731.1 ATPase [Porphyromonas gingivalis]PDP62801.1 ATPase [Porphyromonas gingivalis]